MREMITGGGTYGAYSDLEAEMALSLTHDELATALGLDAEDENIERLRRLGRVMVEKRAPNAPSTIQNEAVIRICGYLIDQPFAPQMPRYTNALRNSGADALLQPYRTHRAGISMDRTPSTDGETPIDSGGFQSRIFDCYAFQSTAAAFADVTLGELEEGRQTVVTGEDLEGIAGESFVVPLEGHTGDTNVNLFFAYPVALPVLKAFSPSTTPAEVFFDLDIGFFVLTETAAYKVYMLSFLSYPEPREQFFLLTFADS